MFAVIGVLVIFISSIYIFYLRKYARLIEITKDWPSPPSLPILGHAHHFINKPPEVLFSKMQMFLDRYGEFLKIWLGPELNIWLSVVPSIEIVLNSTNFNTKASEYAVLEPWLKEGLLVSATAKWFKRRKIITPAFHFKILEQFVNIFVQQSQVLVEKLEKIDPNESTILYDYVNLCTLDSICESAMGVSVKAQINTESEYVKAVKTISTVLHRRMFDIFCRFNFTYQFTKLARDEKKALNVLHHFTEQIIIQRREEILNNQKEEQTSEDADIGAKKKMAFLDILLQSQIDGKPLSNLDIREEVDTFMFEGHDTTSSAITFLFYNIALNPKCQEKCFEEIEAIFDGERDKALTYEELNKLSYTELCIKETLRMFPSVPLLGRKVTKECEINGRVIPAGTNIGISPLHVGRSEKYFPNPDQFIPERFDVVMSAEKMNPYAYIPFSAGPRNCIGQKFAMLEIKSVAAYVLHNFQLEYAGDPKQEPVLVAELILRTKEPLMFKIKKRI